MSSAIWVTLLTIGELVWSPRASAYAAGMCPSTDQGIFMAIVGSPRVMFNFVGTIVAGKLLENFVPPCHTCQDSLGYFCDRVRTQSLTEALSYGVVTSAE